MVLRRAGGKALSDVKLELPRLVVLREPVIQRLGAAATDVVDHLDHVAVVDQPGNDDRGKEGGPDQQAAASLAVGLRGVETHASEAKIGASLGGSIEGEEIRALLGAQGRADHSAMLPIEGGDGE